MLYLSYINLTPGLTNLYSDKSHQPLIKVLRDRVRDWKGFELKHPGYNMGLIVVTKRGIDELEIKGPSISRKHKVVDFSIFLPEKIKDLDDYLNCFFNGLILILEEYGVAEMSILEIRREIKID